EIQSPADKAVDQIGRPISIGTIVVQGLAGAAVPRGLAVVGGGNFSVVGGTGAFVGARGQGAFTPPAVPSPVPSRSASFAEVRTTGRTLEGAALRLHINLTPLARPEVVTGGNGPAVVHSSDNSPVTPAAPALSGELLTLYATGCGPTQPALNPGEVFL